MNTSLMRSPNPRKPRFSHHFNAGPSHVRYDHKQRPTRIEIVCPACGGRAIAKEPAHDEGCLIVGDLSPSWDKPVFAITCTACFYRAQAQRYIDLPEPFHQISVSGRTLWAWNTDHLKMIRKALCRESLKGDPYAFFATYLHRGWQQWRRRFVQAIERHLVTHR